MTYAVEAHGLRGTGGGTPEAVRVARPSPDDSKAGALLQVQIVDATGAVMATLPVSLASIPLPTGAATDAALGSSPTFAEFSSFGSPIDLTGHGAGYCRRIQIVTAGTVTLLGRTPYTPVSGDQITVYDGQMYDVEATSIVSVSGVTKITVFW